ncbi:MAG: 5'-nucleotidase C-terminal domain-containing protein [Acetobacteraceae bacterium]|nr:5'-nucleotidase C-terminal domain-containing protein [Acetobacteraceae bacterium]
MQITRRTLLAALATLPMARMARGEVAHRLTILHVNDIHSRHEAVDARSLTCKAGSRPDCLGGTARLATALFTDRDAARAAGRDVLQLDAGDQFQGSLYYTAWKGEVELAVAHAFGTEAMTVGNHEFDNGPDTLARFVRGATFPVLSANIDASAEPSLAGLLRPSVLFTRAGLKIGVVGATTLQTATTSSPGPLIRFTDPGAALAAQAAQLRAQGAQLVIALSHLGVEQDRLLAGHIPGVDAFIGGHSHTLLSDSEAGAAGPAHEMITGPAGSAIVVQAACYARYFGRLDLDIDAQGRLLAVGGDVRHVGPDLPEEPGVAAIIGHYAAQLDSIRRRVVGTAPAAIDVTSCRVAECSFGNFIADALLAATPSADVALFNGGGMRTGLPAGKITLGDVLTALPYGNTTATVQVSGDDLRQTLANGVARAGSGAFPQIGGMRFVWSPQAPKDQRLGRVDIRQHDGGYAPLDPMRVYTVVTNNFIRTGGDGYTMLRDHGRNAYDTGPGVDEIVQQAIARLGRIAPQVEGRITTE